MDFEKVARALSIVASIGSTTQKQTKVLRFAEHVDGFKEVLKFIYDPAFTTGLKRKKLERVLVHSVGLEMTAEEIMSYLITNSTGTDLDAAIAKGFCVSGGTDIWYWAAEGLVTKDLQIGVSVTMLNKIFGSSFIPKIGIMRGTLCPENALGVYIATEKIDGNRRLIITKDTGVEIYTRSGKRDYGLVEIEEQAKQLPKNVVYDTECIALGEFKDSIALRQASASILNAGGKRKGIKALVFDMLPLKDYENGKSKDTALLRKTRLAGLFGDFDSTEVLWKWYSANGLHEKANTVNAIQHSYSPVLLPNIMSLPILGIVRNKPEALELAKPIWDTGGEGIMLVEDSSPYEVNPNPRKTLLKIKQTAEYTLRCIDVHEGDNKYEGMLGAIEVEYQRCGVSYYLKVGSGFTDWERQYYWDSPYEIIGKTVEIDAFGESRNKDGSYSLSCPVFKRIVGVAQ